MKPNSLIKAALAAGVSVGLAFAPVANADPSSESPTGQQGFFVPGINGGTDPQRYLNPEVPFPFHVVDYPRNVFPINGFSSVDASVAAGVANLITSIKDNGTPYEEFGDFVHITCYGHGCAVVHRTKPAFQEGGELEDYYLYEVTTFRDASNGDGGIYTKMPRLPGFTPVNQDDYQDAVVEQTITYRYDLVSDAPDKPGLLALLNSFAAAAYYGDDYGFDQLQDAIDDGRVVTTVTTNEDGSTRVHYLMDDPDRGLPLTKLFRDVFLALNNDAGDVKVHEFWDGVDAVLKPHIDNRYNTGPNPEVNQREVSTVNGAPVTPPPAEEEQESEEPAEQSSFSAPDDNQVASRSAAAKSSSVSNEVKPDDNVVNQDNSPQGSPVGNEVNSVNNSTQTDTVDQPVKKTWKERQAERKAERDAKKAERQAEREAKKAERQQRREERNQGVQASANDNLSSSDDGANDGNNDNGGGDNNGSSGGTGDGGSES